MSFDEFAKRIASTPEATAGAAARAAELARKPFAEAFVNEVYPHWQGPLKTMSGKQGVESVTHSHVAGLPPWGGVVQTLQPWLITEVLTVSTHVGVRAVVAYAFSGSADDGRVVRLAGFAEKGFTVELVPEGPASPVTLASGPLAALTAALVADVDAASKLFGLLLVAGLDARQDRVARESAAKEAAEKARAEAEQKAKEDAERRLKEETEAGAAAMLERREVAEAEKK